MYNTLFYNYFRAFRGLKIIFIVKNFENPSLFEHKWTDRSLFKTA